MGILRIVLDKTEQRGRFSRSFLNLKSILQGVALLGGHLTTKLFRNPRNKNRIVTTGLEKSKKFQNSVFLSIKNLGSSFYKIASMYLTPLYLIHSITSKASSVN